ncbi:hypothetical protein DDI_0085 [Dickeya dianthicola RNS04.9]|nr:hypothetical protein DDI_0085 [Dickeya dianthicola RNS04.9]
MPMGITLPLLFHRYSRIPMMMIVNKFDDDWRHRNEGIKKPRQMAGS